MNPIRNFYYPSVVIVFLVVQFAPTCGQLVHAAGPQTDRQSEAQHSEQQQVENAERLDEVVGLIDANKFEQAEKKSLIYFEESSDPNFRMLQLQAVISGRGKTDFQNVDDLVAEMTSLFKTDSYALSGMYNVLTTQPNEKGEHRYKELALRALTEADKAVEHRDTAIAIYLARTLESLGRIKEMKEVLHRSIKSTSVFIAKEQLRSELGKIQRIEFQKILSRAKPDAGDAKKFGESHFTDQLFEQNVLLDAEQLSQKTAFKSADELFANVNAAPLMDVAMQEPAVENLEGSEFYEQVSQSVLVVFTLEKVDSGFAIVSASSAFLISGNGICVTNYHVFGGEDLPSIVVTREGQVYVVEEYLAVDRENDLTIFKIDARNMRPLPVIAGKPVGAEVRVIAHPSSRAFTYTTGVLSRRYSRQSPGMSKPFLDMIAITADYAIGSSGGPVMDQAGNVIGVVRENLPIKATKGEQEIQMTVKACVPAEKILELIQQAKHFHK